MRLKSLTLSQFRRFEHFEIDFDEQLTVLVGNNGLGKTAVLDAAAVAIGTLLKDFASAEQRAIVLDDVRYATEELGSTVQTKRQFPTIVSATGSIASGGDESLRGKYDHITWSRSLNGERGRTTWSEASNVVDISRKIRQDLQSNDSSNVILPLLTYYGTGRLWSQHRDGSKPLEYGSQRVDGYKSCLKGTTMDADMLGWMRKMSFVEYQEQKVVPELQTVQQAIEACFQRFTNQSCEVRYYAKADDIYVRHRGEELPLRLLSDGYRTLLGLVADIARRMAVLNPQLGEGITKCTSGVVLIDEVDLHLHPRWQSRVLGDLTSIFPSVQFIVTSHSPTIISSVGREHIRILEETCGRIPVNQTYGRDSSSIYREVMDAPERAPEVEKLFSEFYRAYDNEEYEKASGIVETIESKIGTSDPELTAANTSLFLMME